MNTNNNLVTDNSDEHIISCFTPVNKVCENLYIGSQLVYKFSELLYHLRIRHIIAIRITNLEEAVQVCEENAIILHNLNTRHSQFKKEFPILMNQVETIIDKIPKDERILICCRSGQHRSVAVVCGLLMKKYNVNYKNAFEFVKDIRKCADDEYIVNYDESNTHEEKWTIL
jgi:hypothetical protein